MKITIPFLIANLLVAATIFPLEKTGIDYDMSRGTKPLEPLFDYGGKMDFIADADGVKSKFSGFEVEEQKNNDKVMILRLTRNKMVKHEFLDFDLTGKFESWKQYDSGFVMAEIRIDEKNNIIIEKTLFDQSGNIQEVLRDEEKKGYLAERNVYSSGKIIRTQKDLNGDGLFEEEIVYMNEDEATLFGEKAEPALLPGGKQVYIAGLYNHGEIITLNANLTEMLIRELSGNAANSMDDVRGYQKFIFAEPKEAKGAKTDLGRKYPNRFELYKAIALKKGDKSELPKVYVISGDVFESKSRVSIYFRLLGPTPLDNITAGSIHLAGKNYSEKQAAEKIAKMILAKMP